MLVNSREGNRVWETGFIGPSLGFSKLFPLQLGDGYLLERQNGSSTKEWVQESQGSYLKQYKKCIKSKEFPVNLVLGDRENDVVGLISRTSSEQSRLI